MNRPPVSVAGAVELLMLFLGQRMRMSVEGESMTPALHHGDTILVDRSAYRKDQPIPGDVVVTRHPFRTDVVIVKRVTAVNEDGALVVRGDNPKHSSDSESLGPIPALHLIGQVTSYRPRKTDGSTPSPRW